MPESMTPADNLRMQIDNFAQTAAAFCAWAEGPPGDANREVEQAIRLLSQLLAGVLDLPLDFDEHETPRIPTDAWTTVFKRFGALPFNYYATVCDPAELENSEVSLGDIADDLADIWCELKAGLTLYQMGHPAAAAWEWRNSFTLHWARHAASALRALHYWQH